MNVEPTTPVLVCVSMAVGETTVDGRRVKAAGLGDRQTWGLQQADILYESLLYSYGQTRLAALFHDALSLGRQVYVGPVRSVRQAHMLISDEWRAALVYSGVTGGNANGAPGLRQLKQHNFALAEKRMHPYRKNLPRTAGRRVKAPDHLSADITGLHDWIKDEPTPEITGFYFGVLPDGFPQAQSVALDWGKETYLGRFVYDAEQNAYLRFQGNAPFMTYLYETGAEKIQLAFANVIVQQVDYDFSTHPFLPLLPLANEGRAIVFTQGCVMEGVWRRNDGRTVYLDEMGRQIPLATGKSYVALFPSTGVLTWE